MLPILGFQKSTTNQVTKGVRKNLGRCTVKRPPETRITLRLVTATKLWKPNGTFRKRCKPERSTTSTILTRHHGKEAIQSSAIFRGSNHRKVFWMRCLSFPRQKQEKNLLFN